MDSKLSTLIYLIVFLISVASATAITSDIYCYSDYYNGLFCFKNNTIFPMDCINCGTEGEYMTESSQPILINGSFKVRDNTVIGGDIIANSCNCSWNGSVNYYTKTQSNNTYLKLDQTNWYNDPNGWLNWNNAEVRLEFNESKLSTVYYNATVNFTIRGTPKGTIKDLQI